MGESEFKVTNDGERHQEALSLAVSISMFAKSWAVTSPCRVSTSALLDCPASVCSFTPSDEDNREPEDSLGATLLASVVSARRAVDEIKMKIKQTDVTFSVEVEGKALYNTMNCSSKLE